MTWDVIAIGVAIGFLVFQIWDARRRMRRLRAAQAADLLGGYEAYKDVYTERELGP